MQSMRFKRKLLVLALAGAVILPCIYLAASRYSQADSDLSGVDPADAFQTTPAGKLVVDAATGLPAVAPLTMNFVRTPDNGGPDHKGRYLIAVNSGYGIEFNSKSKPQQTVSVIDLNIVPDPQVVQTLYFPGPQSANVGLVFDPKLGLDGKYRLYLSGGYENKIWILAFDPAAKLPLAPKNKPDDKFDAPFLDVSGFAENAPSPNYNGNVAAIYPTGIALSPDGETIYSANNLGDTLGVISDLRDSRKIERISLRRPGSAQFVYPYDAKVLPAGRRVSKVYISLWGDGSVAVVNRAFGNRLSHITVGRHPTAMLFNNDRSRLFVANSNGDSVSVIDTRLDRVVEAINVRLSETAALGAAPEGLALSDNEKTLYVANAQANAVAVVRLAAPASKSPSKLLGFIPSGKYASAVAVVGNRLIIANGKGTGMENSSLKVNETGFYPNMPNKDFPGEGYNKRGLYSVSAVSGNISVVDIPDEKRLFEYTQAVMRNNGLLSREKRNIFPGGKSPFKHVIYVIRENRTYDQVLGDIDRSGDGQKADGDESVTVFGAGKTSRSPNGEKQNITPNAHALALRFGLLDRFFVNAEASPDGHNWSTAAFSSDFVDKSFRWNYSRRGRTYDFEGFNRLPSYSPPSGQPPVALPPVFDLPATAADVANFEKKYVPYLNGARDIAEPETLYLWDAAKRAGLSYKNFGEFIGTVSEEDVSAVNTRRPKRYPDTSPTVTTFATKRSLEGHFSTSSANFDLDIPDIITTDSYKAARESKTPLDPTITSASATQPFRGNSRFAAWQAEFRVTVGDLQVGRGDHLPNLSIVRLSNDHTNGMSRGKPTPQFYVADNDFALGRLVEEVSNSPYWNDTAIFVVEDDAQDGSDHVDAHRSPGFVISAYNRPGALVHELHNTVSLIRTLELCIGLEPMNFLDANATPIDIFTSKADLRPFTSQLPTVALDNLFPPDRPNRATQGYMKLTSEQDFSHPDMADPQVLNEIIWFSVRGDEPMPAIARLPAFELMTAGIKREDIKDNSEDGE